MQRAQEGLQGFLLVDGEMAKGVAGKAKQVEAEVFLIGVLGILVEAYLGDVLGLGPEEAWWAVQKSAPAWRAVESYEHPTRSRQQLHGKERLERV